MSKANLTPITKESQPTSHVRVGRSQVTETDAVRISHRGRDAYFRVETENDRVDNRIGNKVYIHENAAAVFGGIDRTSDFIVDDGVSLRAIPRCKSAEIAVQGVAEEKLAEWLREREYLLHPIEEVAEVGNTPVRFTVTGLEPERFTTLRVDDETSFEFTDEPVSPPSGSTSTPPRTGGNREGQGGADHPDADEVDVELTAENPTKSFEDDVAGLESVRETARMLLALFEPDVRTEVEERYGEEFAHRGGSMLLYGPPGCGKTLVSEAIAYEAKHNTRIEEEFGDVRFLQVRGSDVTSKYMGESEKRVKATFERAHELARDGFVVLFFDEVETLIPDRSDDNLKRSERAVTNAFLQEMNDVEDNLFVIGATNMPFSIDPAATRRFPIQQFIPQPDAEVMAEVWAKHCNTFPNADEIDFERLGEASVGFTPAEIADRVLGSDLQRELVRSVVEPGREPIEPTTEYLLERLDAAERKTVRQYVTSVYRQADELEGYPEFKRYVEAQVEELGLGGNGPGDRLQGAMESVATALADGTESDDESTESPLDDGSETDEESPDG